MSAKILWTAALAVLTAAKGFHIAVPLDGKSSYGVAARFAHTVGTRLVERGTVQPAGFTLRSMAARLGEVGDLWAGMSDTTQSLREAMARLRA